MKQLFTELQEAGLKEEEIRKIPDEVAWEMAKQFCEKCGGETRVRLIGDEVVAYCEDCDWVTN